MASIVRVSELGQRVELDDGTEWLVPLGDNTIAVCWYATQRVKVEKGGDRDYPYRLHNLDTSGDVVKAKPR